MQTSEHVKRSGNGTYFEMIQPQLKSSTSGCINDVSVKHVSDSCNVKVGNRQHAACTATCSGELKPVRMSTTAEGGRDGELKYF